MEFHVRDICRGVVRCFDRYLTCFAYSIETPHLMLNKFSKHRGDHQVKSVCDLHAIAAKSQSFSIFFFCNHNIFLLQIYVSPITRSDNAKLLIEKARLCFRPATKCISKIPIQLIYSPSGTGFLPKKKSKITDVMLYNGSIPFGFVMAVLLYLTFSFHKEKFASRN